jgi:glycosyltransferase involved in cell wall biosynthesis
VNLLAMLGGAAAVGQAVTALALRKNHDRMLDLDQAPAALPELPPLAVLVPARNEEANISTCVRALAAAHYPHLRIRVIDDGSTDRTAEIVRELAANDPRIELVSAGELPAGWLGKNHALHQGVQGAREPYLLFVDADLRVGEDALMHAVAAAMRCEVDLLSMVPTVEAVTFWELCVQPLVTQVICAFVPVDRVHDPDRKEGAAIGPFMLFRRTAYEQIGGHAAVRAEVVDDVRLAEAIKRARLRLVIGHGATQARVRMYDSLGAILRGWGKNAHSALGGALWLAPVVAALELFFFAGPYVLPVVAALYGTPLAFALAVAALALAVASRVVLHRRFGVTLRGMYLTPLGAAILAFVLVRSASRAARKKPIVWRDRKVV